jgi:hypothetical protein
MLNEMYMPKISSFVRDLIWLVIFIDDDRAKSLFRSS